MKHLPFLIALIFCAACTEKEPLDDVDLGYDFYPATIGSYIVYQVDSVYHDQPNPDIAGIHDTTHYYLKEYFHSSFTDNAGRPSIRLERYKADSLNGLWQLTDVWAVTKTAEQLEKVEENMRFIRLAFPVNEQREWDGNSLNTLPAWTYTYANIGETIAIADTTFAPSLRVNQRDEVNAVEVQNAYEIYAKEVGLVYKYYKNLSVRINYQSAPVAQNIRLGTEYSWKFVKQGYE